QSRAAYSGTRGRGGLRLLYAARIRAQSVGSLAPAVVPQLQRLLRWRPSARSPLPGVPRVAAQEVRRVWQGFRVFPVDAASIDAQRRRQHQSGLEAYDRGSPVSGSHFPSKNTKEPAHSLSCRLIHVGRSTVTFAPRLKITPSSLQISSKGPR